MYGNLLGEKVAPTEVASAPLQHAGRSVSTLDALATCNAAGRKWRIALVNRHPVEPLRCGLQLGSKALEGKFRATVLAGDSPEAYNGVERPNRVAPQITELAVTGGQVALPPHSVTILEVE
jgi:alpha-L-arabinofuranosidase